MDNHPRQAEIDAHWAGKFCTTPDQVRNAGVQVLSKADQPIERIDTLRVGEGYHIVCHGALLGHLDSFKSPEPLEEVLPKGWVLRVEGEEIWYVRPEKLARQSDPRIRKLTATDSEAFNAFAARIRVLELEEAQVALDDPLVLGVYEDALIAVASLQHHGDHIADIGVLTSPEARGKGLGKMVAGAAAWWALTEGRIPQYRFKQTNYASRGVAESLCFQPYAVLTQYHLSQQALPK
ncbi:MAG: GNAT family N-acetyltransferase [Fimbriimonadaceae bacterium]